MSFKRVRIVRRADGFYVQFCVDAEYKEDVASTGQEIGLDFGLEHFYTDSNGHHIDVQTIAFGTGFGLDARIPPMPAKLRGGSVNIDYDVKQAQCHRMQHSLLCHRIPI